MQITRNSPGDEIANVNFLYDDIVHVLQNTIYSCIRSATDRRGYVRGEFLTLTLSLKVIPCQYHHNWYIVKNYIIWPTFLTQKVGLSVYLQSLLLNPPRKLCRIQWN